MLCNIILLFKSDIKVRWVGCTVNICFITLKLTHWMCTHATKRIINYWYIVLSLTVEMGYKTMSSSLAVSLSYVIFRCPTGLKKLIIHSIYVLHDQIIYLSQRKVNYLNDKKYCLLYDIVSKWNCTSFNWKPYGLSTVLNWVTISFSIIKCTV